MHQPLLQPGISMDEAPLTMEKEPPKRLWDKVTAYRTMAREAYKSKPISYWILLLLSSGAILIAFPASSLLSRLYFSNGGKSKWIISWVAVAGWPLSALILIPMYLFYDMYGNITRRQYILGFVWDILGSALHGLIFALSEKVFVKLLGRLSFHVVLEQQVMVSFFGFLFTTIGLIVNNDFQGMSSEARTFKGGKSAYYLVIIWSVITFQLGVMGATSVVFLSSTVLAGVLNAVRVPLTSIAAVILLKDPMSGFKILSLIITFWGFGSYIYGNYPANTSHK